MTNRERDEIRKLLNEALSIEGLVWIERRRFASWRRGFVVGWDGDWVLLHEVETNALVLNGYTAIRWKDISGVEWDESFLVTALKLRGERARPQHDLLLIDLPGLLSSVAAHYPLISVHTEKAGRGFWCGRVMKLGSKKLTLRPVNRGAEWTAPRHLRYKDITRIEFGDGYQDGLWLVAGPRRRNRNSSDPRS